MLKLRIQFGATGGTCAFRLNKKVISVGRHSDNDIIIKQGSVSAFHAQIECHRNGDLFLIDNDSLNGTFHNGTRVDGTVKLLATDIMSFGGIQCTIADHRPEQLPGGPAERLLSEQLEHTRDGFSFALQQANTKKDEAVRILDIATAELDKREREIAELKQELKLLRKNAGRQESTHSEHLPDKSSDSESVAKITPNEEHLQLLNESLEEFKSVKNTTSRDPFDDELTNNLLDRQQGILSRKSLFHESDSAVDQEFFRGLISWLEMFDDLHDYYSRNWLFPKLSSQMKIMKESFVTLLIRNSIDPFEFEPGENLTIEARKRIQLVHVDDLDDPKLKRAARTLESSPGVQILGTLRPGYIYRKNEKDVIIRKADVVVA